MNATRSESPRLLPMAGPEALSEMGKTGHPLRGRAVLVAAGGDGLGRSVALAFAREGADVAVVYRDAADETRVRETRRRVEALGRRCLLIRANLDHPASVREAEAIARMELGPLAVVAGGARPFLRAPLLYGSPSEARAA